MRWGCGRGFVSLRALGRQRSWRVEMVEGGWFGLWASYEEVGDPRSSCSSHGPPVGLSPIASCTLGEGFQLHQKAELDVSRCSFSPSLVILRSEQQYRRLSAKIVSLHMLALTPTLLSGLMGNRQAKGSDGCWADDVASPQLPPVSRLWCTAFSRETASTAFASAARIPVTRCKH